MAWEITATDEFVAWYASLSQPDQDALDGDVDALRQLGPMLGRPRVDTVGGSKYRNMKELRTGTMRSFFAFDPRRTAILLIGGDKRSDKRFYDRMLLAAERLYELHLAGLQRNGSSNEDDQLG